MAFQTQSGLPASGIVDAATWQALGSRVVPPADDPTMTQLASQSRDHRASFAVSTFVNSVKGQDVVRRESGGICSIVSSNGRWAGKWQMDANFWSYYGGLQFAASANLATCEQQDLVAYNGWVDRWWQPWSTAGV